MRQGTLRRPCASEGVFASAAQVGALRRLAIAAQALTEPLG
jgi:hypothetical protein